MSYILGLSGRKQSGKNTTANFLLGIIMQSLGLIRKDFVMSDEGTLWISDLLGDEECAGIFDYYRDNPHMDDMKEEYIHPFVKLYSFADLLKKNVCMDAMGLTFKQCYGTDDDKNTETRYRWENMPGISENFTPPSSGIMTARDVMQYVGTNMFRRMYGNIWVDALVRQIQKESTGLAIITDIRFPNEVTGIHDAGGKVMRFMRNPFKDEDCHESETALDQENFDWDEFDWVIDNNCSVLQQCNLVQQALMDSGWLQIVEEA